MPSQAKPIVTFYVNRIFPNMTLCWFAEAKDWLGMSRFDIGLIVTQAHRGMPNAARISTVKCNMHRFNLTIQMGDEMLASRRDRHATVTLVCGMSRF